MTVSGLQFSAQVSDWVKQTEARMTAVFRESTQRLVSQAQYGNPHIPVDTGFARASIRASLSSMPQIDPSFKGTKGGSYGDTTGQVTLVIAGANIGQTIYIGWTANYVIHLEYGHSQQAPSGFIRINALQWPRIVSEVSAEARGRVGT